MEVQWDSNSYRIGPPKYCNRCGKTLERSVHRVTRYNEYTGEKYEHIKELYECPEYSTAPSIGHTFQYYDDTPVWVVYDT